MAGVEIQANDRNLLEGRAITQAIPKTQCGFICATTEQEFCWLETSLNSIYHPIGISIAWVTAISASSTVN